MPSQTAARQMRKTAALRMQHARHLDREVAQRIAETGTGVDVKLVRHYLRAAECLGSSEKTTLLSEAEIAAKKRAEKISMQVDFADAPDPQ